MSFYNMLFGVNGQTDLILAVVGLKKVDVQRFRDCDASQDGTEITVYSRTGGGNREGYPNIKMRKVPCWVQSVDDDYDSTYCTDTFKTPAEFVGDVVAIRDILTNGLRKEFAQHLSRTLNREPEECDREQAAYDAELYALNRTRHFKANGHTFVPQDDNAMETALKLAEENTGTLRTCWGLLPLVIKVSTNSESCGILDRVSLDYEWQIDAAYWEHCKKKWLSKFPLTMAKIEESVQSHSKTN
jgi:hypothetical protein